MRGPHGDTVVALQAAPGDVGCAGMAAQRGHQLGEMGFKWGSNGVVQSWDHGHTRGTKHPTHPWRSLQLSGSSTSSSHGAGGGREVG